MLELPNNKIWATKQKKYRSYQTMKPIVYKGEEGYFIPTPEKKELDKILKSYLNNCGDDCNVE